VPTKKPLDPAIAERVRKGVAHFEATMGHLPVQMKTMSERMPEMFAGYMDIRQWVMRDPPEGAMPRKYKHLIFTLLDLVYTNAAGAENHARAALRNGLTIDELLEGMGQILIVGGVGVYGTTGYKVLDNVLASEEGRAAQRHADGSAGTAKARPARKAAARK
jgi:alkylhydroperoxidase/carboxymuconolactone decarboxylase family protein YurZ